MTFYSERKRKPFQKVFEWFVSEGREKSKGNPQCTETKITLLQFAAGNLKRQEKKKGINKLLKF